MKHELRCPYIAGLFGSHNQHPLESSVHYEINHDLGFAATWLGIKGSSISGEEVLKSLELMIPGLGFYFEALNFHCLISGFRVGIFAQE